MSSESSRSTENEIKPHEPTTNNPRHKFRTSKSSKTFYTNNIYLEDLRLNYEITDTPKKGYIGFTNFVTSVLLEEKYATKTSYHEIDPDNSFFISREMTNLINIQHPTIAKIHGFSYEDFDKKNNITIILDYFENGSLADLLQKESHSDYDSTKQQIILTGIVRAMIYLHKNRIIHRDLKPENVLLDKNYFPVLTDYGLSKLFNPNGIKNKTSSNIESVAYLAPEVLKNNRYSTKSDVYSFGILMYEVLARKRAYTELFSDKKFDQSKFQNKILKEGLRPKFDFQIKKGLQKMIEACWSQDPKKRPTFQELFNKLTMFEEDDMNQSGENFYKPVIKDNDDEEEEDEKDNSSSYKKYCIDGVNEEEFFKYVDEIYDDGQTTEQNIDQDLESLKEKIEELESSYISQIKNNNFEIKEKISKLQNDIKSIKDKNKLITGNKSEQDKDSSNSDEDAESGPSTSKNDSNDEDEESGKLSDLLKIDNLDKKEEEKNSDEQDVDDADDAESDPSTSKNDLDKNEEEKDSDEQDVDDAESGPSTSKNDSNDEDEESGKLSDLLKIDNLDKKEEEKNSDEQDVDDAESGPSTSKNDSDKNEEEKDSDEQDVYDADDAESGPSTSENKDDDEDDAEVENEDNDDDDDDDENKDDESEN